MVPDESNDSSRRTVIKVAGGLAGLSALSGVGAASEDDASSRQSTPSQQGERVGMVTSSGNVQVFTAPVLWVQPGTTVTWELRSGTHSTTAYAPANDKPQRIPQDAQAWDSGVLTEQGATFQRTFDTEGVFDYYCTPHEAVGMLGRIVVGAPDLANEPALSEPQNALPETARQIISGFNTVTQAMFGQAQG